MGAKIFFGTVLLEKNRWAAGRQPSLKVSEWAPRIKTAGFDGIELWANHAILADPVEQAALDILPLPVAIYSSYLAFDDAGAAGRDEAAAMIKRLKAGGVKFNFGNDMKLVDVYCANLEGWRRSLPAGCRLISECHGGTVLEEPARAAEILNPFGSKIEIIVHAFTVGQEALEAWFRHFGPKITHIHAARNVPREGFHALHADPAFTRARLDLLRRLGFQGTITLEFTAGCGKPDEDIETLFDDACKDAALLREA